MQLRHELRPLTSLRGIAAWWVVLYHIRDQTAGWMPAPLSWVQSMGYLAVDLFFLLSGFVIWLNYGPKLRAAGMAAAPAFLWRRLARIYPLHFVTLIGAIAYAGLSLALGKREILTDFPLEQIPLQLLLLQNWGFAHLGWNAPAWTISCELGAYLAFALIAPFVNLQRWPAVALIGVGTLMLLAMGMAFVAGGWPHLGNGIAELGLWRCLGEFGAGTTVGALWLRWRGQRRAVIASLLILAAATTARLLDAPQPLTLPIALAALLFALALTVDMPRHPLSGRVVHYLGEISYATYMVHFLGFLAFKLLLVRDAAILPPLQTAGFIATILIASMLIHHLIELPAQRWLNRRMPRFRRTGAGTARA